MYTIADTAAFILTDLTADTWTLRDAVPDLTESGPDNLRLVYEGFFPDALHAASPDISDFGQGIAPPVYDGDGTWRIIAAVPSRMSGPFWRVEVAAKGAIATKANKVRWITGSSTVSGDNVTVPVVGLKPKVSSKLPEVGVEIGYLSFAGTPTTPDAGVAATPASPAPPTPDNPWTSIAADQAVYYYPNGWVRDSVDADRIVPNLWWITERYSFVFEVTA